MNRLFTPAILLLLLPSNVSSQVWSEAGDAPSFPDIAHQVTRGSSSLAQIIGETAGSDLFDAYCIRIVEPFFFVATTDPATLPGSDAGFDTQLFLFDAYGAPILANNNTSTGGAPNLSTLTSTATDGSGFVLDQRGVYTLVIGGEGDDPLDPGGDSLFDFASGQDLVHFRDAAAGRFDEWEAGSTQFGNYVIALEGVEFCQEELGAVFSRSGGADRVCRPDGAGGIASCSDLETGTRDTRDTAFGYVTSNRHMELLLGVNADRDRVCGGGSAGFTLCTDAGSVVATTRAITAGYLDDGFELDFVSASDMGTNTACYGDGGGLFQTCSVIIDIVPFLSSFDVKLGFLDGDAFADMVVATSDNENRVCLNDQSGGFSACSSVSTDTNESQGVALGRVDLDNAIDAVFANLNGPNRLCLGNGLGGFTSCSTIEPGGSDSTDVALGFVDADGNLDAVFSNDGQVNRVCLGDGAGNFSCGSVSSAAYPTLGVALGLFDADSHLDAVFAGDPDQICLGDGAGGFTCSDASTGGTAFPSTSVALGEVLDPSLFADGFESGDTAAWGTTVP
ncbi:MAG: hypothetical protein K0U98_25870 [Deltaproteobacteria bacterium]|nr:hypothetical protein [Deltaproteobacteria bacterium]